MQTKSTSFKLSMQEFFDQSIWGYIGETIWLTYNPARLSGYRAPNATNRSSSRSKCIAFIQMISHIDDNNEIYSDSELDSPTMIVFCGPQTPNQRFPNRTASALHTHASITRTDFSIFIGRPHAIKLQRMRCHVTRRARVYIPVIRRKFTFFFATNAVNAVLALPVLSLFSFFFLCTHSPNDLSIHNCNKLYPILLWTPCPSCINFSSWVPHLIQQFRDDAFGLMSLFDASMPKPLKNEQKSAVNPAHEITDSQLSGTRKLDNLNYVI